MQNIENRTISQTREYEYCIDGESFRETDSINILNREFKELCYNGKIPSQKERDAVYIESTSGNLSIIEGNSNESMFLYNAFLAKAKNPNNGLRDEKKVSSPIIETDNNGYNRKRLSCFIDGKDFFATERITLFNKNYLALRSADPLDPSIEFAEVIGEELSLIRDFYTFRAFLYSFTRVRENPDVVCSYPRGNFVASKFVESESLLI